MSVFPVFIEMKDKKAVVFGGGAVALRKIKSLLDAETKVSVYAREILPEIKVLPVEWTEISVEISDIDIIERCIDDAFLVICATDSVELNLKIAEIADSKRVLYNTASGRAKGSFIFPAVARNEEYVIGISTDGKSPADAKAMRIRIEEILGK